ncbi:DUF305 domain-containing protein [Nonomuraea sp. SBT364]|uniref:DUF305 domain-containing protein n=1 Tax=Nonomuraea sp. SBT364 TaxID=1580530 RepID=UPI00069D1327|nr:DUF305 domain-containing protein [Nonomuraea sp. SBT364]
MKRIGLLLALLLAACPACSSPAGERAPAAHGSHAPSGTHAPSRTHPGAGFNATDTAWVQLMIPMIERTLPLLDLAARRGTGGTRGLAAALGRAHRAELDRLRKLRDDAGVSPVNVHEGHDMPGMVTASQLDDLRAAGGKAFDELFARRLREHLDQSLKVTRGERGSGSDPRALALAADLVRSRTGQLAQLARLGALASATS